MGGSFKTHLELRLACSCARSCASIGRVASEVAAVACRLRPRKSQHEESVTWWVKRNVREAIAFVSLFLKLFEGNHP